MIEYITGFVIGVIIGLILMECYYLSNYMGTLVVDISDPNKDKYSIELEDLDKVNNKKRVILKIKKSQ